MAAPGPMHFYAKNADKFNASALTTLKMQLHTNSYTPNITATGHSVLADLTAEVSNANGYTTGGFDLTGESIVADAGNDGFKISTGNASWTASGAGITCRYAVLYNSGTTWGVTSPLVGYILLDSAPADVVVASGNTLQINCPADGWGKITSS